MSSGYIGGLGSAGSIVFTPPVTGMIFLACSGGPSGTAGIVSVNGTTVFQTQNTYPPQNGIVKVAATAGVPLTLAVSGPASFGASFVEGG